MTPTGPFLLTMGDFVVFVENKNTPVRFAKGEIVSLGLLPSFAQNGRHAEAALGCRPASTLASVLPLCILSALLIPASLVAIVSTNSFSK